MPVLTARQLFLGLTIAWSVAWLAIAFQRWRFESVCVMACPAFLSADMPELIEAFRRANDWRTPLLLAGVPLLLLALAFSFRRFAARHPS